MPACLHLLQIGALNRHLHEHECIPSPRLPWPVLLLHEYLLFLQVRLLSRHTGHTIEEVDKEINRPRYFEPYEAVEWGLIDKVGGSLRELLQILLHQCLHAEGGYRLLQVLEPEEGNLALRAATRLP